MTRIIVPIKRLAQAKRRLGAALPQRLRAELVLGMLDDLLTALTELSAGPVCVIAGDMEVFDLARRKRTEVLAEENTGYNAAVSQALAASPPGPVAILPGDLPLASPTDIAELTAPAPPGEVRVRLAPDRAMQGTNGLFLSAKDVLAPAFGPGSFARHNASAKASSLICEVVTNSGLALDIDTLDDLHLLRTKARQGATAALLRTPDFEHFREQNDRGAA